MASLKFESATLLAPPFWLSFGVPAIASEGSHDVVEHLGPQRRGRDTHPSME